MTAHARPDALAVALCPSGVDECAELATPTVRRLQERAERRRTMAERLAIAIVETAVRHNLIDAILDDACPPRAPQGSPDSLAEVG